MHPTIMFRKDIIEKAELTYNKDYKVIQDYDLWSRAVDKVRLENIPEVLLRYRYYKSNLTQSSKKKYRFSVLSDIFKRQLSRLHIEPDLAEIELHNSLTSHDPIKTYDYIKSAKKWLLKIIKMNEKYGIYSHESLKRKVAELWFRIHWRATGIGYKNIISYFSSGLRGKYKENKVDLLKIIIKSIIRYGK